MFGLEGSSGDVFGLEGSSGECPDIWSFQFPLCIEPGSVKKKHVLGFSDCAATVGSSHSPACVCCGIFCLAGCQKANL